VARYTRLQARSSLAGGNATEVTGTDYRQIYSETLHQPG
jgi:hypothetical protein